VGLLENLARDVRVAARLLRRSPGFTAVSVVTLALGIGANTAIFSIVDAVLLRPLPYPDPARLADVVRISRYKGEEGWSVSQDGRMWEAVRDGVPGIDAAPFGAASTGVNLVARGHAEYVRQQRVGAGFFRVLGIPPVIGREFTRDEDRPGGAAVAVLSDALWRRAFDADPEIVGRSVLLRGEPYTIVGVMPATFRSNTRTDLWTPLRPSLRGEGGGTNYRIVGRLRPSVDWAQADAQAAVAGAAAIQALRLSPDVAMRAGLQPLQEGLTEGLRRPLQILWAAVGLVLVIACVNVAGLMLARGSTRVREISTRMALGSGRAAIVRQMLVESLLLGAAGAGAGIAVGYAGLRVLQLLARDVFEIAATVSLDARVLAATASMALLATLLFGLAPAVAAARTDLRSGLIEQGTRGITGSSRRWGRRSLVIAEVAVGMVLLVGAGLLVRTLQRLRNLEPGFEGDNVAVAWVSLQDARYSSVASVNRLFDETLERIRALPGVESAAVVLGLPYERLLNMGFRRVGDAKGNITNLCYTTPDYFSTLRIPLVRGRALTLADRAGTQPVAIVNEAFVRAYLRDHDPEGSRIEIAGAERAIVGVVGDVQVRPGWGDFGPLAATACVYIPAAQTSDGFLRLVHTWFTPDWVVRTSPGAVGIAAGIRRAVEAVDPNLPVAGFRSMNQVRSESIALQRLLATLLGGLAALALVLAAIGIYGLVAQSVAERTRELGVRMALGATAGQAMSAIAVPSIAVVAAGVVLGCVLSRLASRALEQMIWGVKPGDPGTFATTAAILLLSGAIGSAVPALRILRLDPARTLREE
jgi:predicted permease